MADHALTAQERALTGKGAARKLRVQGFVPAVLYGNLKKSKTLAVPERLLSRIMSSNVGLIDLTIEGEAKVRPVIIKDVQKDPLTGGLTHVDFLQVNLKQPITTTVPVILVGEEKRGNDGGILEHLLREVQVTCLPTSIPEHIEIDVAGLKVHEAIHVADVKLPKGVEAATDLGEVIVSVVAPTKPQEEAAEPAETAAAE